MKTKLAWVVLVLLLVLPIGLADPPFVSADITNIGILVQEVDIPYFIENEYHSFRFHIYNQTNGMPMDNSSAGCIFHLYNRSGDEIFETDTNITFENIYDFDVTVTPNNFTEPGYYSYIFQCNNSAIGGFVSRTFLVNTSGIEGNPLLAGLIFFLLFGIAILFGVMAFKLEDEHFALKFSSVIISSFFILMSFQYALLAANEYLFGNLAEILGDFWFITVLIVIILIAYLLISLTKMAMEYWKSLRFR